MSTVFSLVHHHKWGTPAELEDLSCFEFDSYTQMLADQLDREREAARQEAARRGR